MKFSKIIASFNSKTKYTKLFKNFINLSLWLTCICANCVKLINRLRRSGKYRIKLFKVIKLKNILFLGFILISCHCLLTASTIVQNVPVNVYFKVLQLYIINISKIKNTLKLNTAFHKKHSNRNICSIRKPILYPNAS